MKRWIWMAAWLSAVVLTFAAVPEVESLEANSSWVRDVTYERDPDGEAGTLRLRLGRDPVFLRYFEVPVEVWEEFKAADSKGAFYAANIRQRFERQYGQSRQEMFKSPLPVQTQVNALVAFNEECESVILECIAKADESIYVAAYAFTRTRIAAALVRARQRGVHVALKMDAGQAEHPGARRLLEKMRNGDIAVTLIHTAGEFASMHNKFMVFDMRWVVTGSYNFTTAAQVSNWENLVWLESADMAEQFKQAWAAIVSDEISEPPGVSGAEAEEEP